MMHKIFPRSSTFLRLNRQLFARRQSSTSPTSTSYVVLLPEDPLDTTENNALLRMPATDLPDYTEITGEKCFSGVGKLSLDFENAVWEIEDKLREEPNEVNFSNVLEPLDSKDARLNMGWSAAKILYIARQDIIPQKTYLSLHERARKARVEKFKNLPIYNACKAISKQDQNLDECQQRIVNKFLLESRLNGIELETSKAEHFGNSVKQLDNRKNGFQQKVVVSAMRFAYNINNPTIVKDFPKELLQRMAVNGSDPSTGPWQVTLKPSVYEPFLEHCSKRSMRWNTWQAYNMMASKHLDPELDNSVFVEEIRKFRLEQARLLGYKNYACMSMETKMAGSVENVLSMITSLMVKAVPRQTEEIKSLTKFALSQGFDGDALQAYDVPYYARLQRQHLYSSSVGLEQYFPLEHVLGVLLGLCSRLFGVHFEEVAATGTWHPSVRCFRVVDDTHGAIATFYLDPYSRPGQKLDPTGGSGWFVSQRSRSTLSSEPLGALIFNFPAPGMQQQLAASSSHDSMLSLRDVTTLFSKFGEALQNLLTTVPYGEASGLTNIEWDAMPMCQHFMANWVYVPQVLSELSNHHETGASLSDQAVKDVIQAANHMAGHNLSKHLYLANLDILLHTTTDFWSTIVTTLWPQYLPYQLDVNDKHMMSFTASMADVWAAAYYSHTWSRLMAADCTKAFLDEGEEEWANVGNRFRSTFLSLGGGCHPAEVFRRFRGRDPSPDALAELYGIN